MSGRAGVSSAKSIAAEEGLRLDRRTASPKKKEKKKL